jgi:hypothetical protein
MIIQLILIILGVLFFIPLIALLMMAYIDLWIKAFEWIDKKFFGGRL